MTRPTKEEFLERIIKEKARRNRLLAREQKGLAKQHWESHIKRKSRKGKYC